MNLSRRAFLAVSAATVAGIGTAAGEHRGGAVSTPRPGSRGYDPWLEIDPAAFSHNAREIARRTRGRPILAVVKNNAYGLGLATVGPILDRLPEVWGLAVVKPEAALALRDAGVAKPVLLMGLWDDDVGTELAARGVHLAPYTDDAAARLTRIAGRLDRPIAVHLYLDTGMSRLGMPYHRALPWIADLTRRPAVAIEGTFMTFTEDDDFDPEQLERFTALARQAHQQRIHLGRLHAASTHGLFFRPDAFLAMVRPGLALYGAYPEGGRATGALDLTPAFRLMARVVRVERLRPGDSVSYGRRYVAERPTWIATLPVGHADGYPRPAVEGCEALIGGRPYRVIGAVSASHSIVEVGEQATVSVGDAATLVGPDDPAIHPNTVAARTGLSVYDVLMHLSAQLPKRLRQ